MSQALQIYEQQNNQGLGQGVSGLGSYAGDLGYLQQCQSVSKTIGPFELVVEKLGEQSKN
jgi:hypothetical protein